ncbi:hypothetical protein [Frigoriflavimonas asaccharolytica]|uniref:Uncharacterized protein n=1 Tax=Frigoriflavimonas asaccharolytica TaxID=2735899 RepID=A0A8J8G970_9FLAO|nr:hypothetical protein [Frigoriflavimonas asaccharolytica]NRS93778.1 hypothetical protein [Frigoriflavimonas asaccharolytica]
MKLILQTFKEYWTFLLIAIYSIAYFYNYVYYTSFGVNIFQYVTISDLMFFSVEQIILLTGLIFIFEVIGTFLVSMFFELFIYKKIQSNLKIKAINRNQLFSKVHADKVFKRYRKSKMFGFFLYFSVFLVFPVILCKYFNIPLLTLGLLASSAFIYLIIRLFLFTKNKGKDSENIKLLAFFIIYISTIYFTSFQAFVSSDEVKFLSETKNNLSFNYQNKLYEVDDNLRFVGESTTYIFLYDKKGESTLIFPKLKVENLKTSPKDSYFFNRMKNTQ